MNRQEQIRKLEAEWAESPRWKGIDRTYSAEDVVKLRGTVQIEHTLARQGAEKFWRLVNQEDPVCGLGALTGNQAVQEVQAGLKAIYCSGWQVAGDGNSAGEMYPDQSLYPVDSVPKMVERINNAFIRTDEIHALNGDFSTDWFPPIIADAEAGFGGNLNEAIRDGRRFGTYFRAVSADDMDVNAALARFRNAVQGASRALQTGGALTNNLRAFFSIGDAAQSILPRSVRSLIHFDVGMMMKAAGVMVSVLNSGARARQNKY